MRPRCLVALTERSKNMITAYLVVPLVFGIALSYLWLIHRLWLRVVFREDHKPTVETKIAGDVSNFERVTRTSLVPIGSPANEAHRMVRAQLARDSSAGCPWRWDPRPRAQAKLMLCFKPDSSAESKSRTKAARSNARDLRRMRMITPWWAMRVAVARKSSRLQVIRMQSRSPTSRSTSSSGVVTGNTSRSLMRYGQALPVRTQRRPARLGRTGTSRCRRGHLASHEDVNLAAVVLVIC